MALKISSLPTSVLPYKIVTESAFNGLHSDITAGSGTLYYLSFNSTALAANNSGVVYYIKISFSSSTVVVGTTKPDVIIPITGSSGGTTITLPLPGGISYTSLSLWLVDSAADNSSSTASPNSGAVSFAAVSK
jgi:hypothetical protein